MSYAKVMQASAMKACFQIAECSLPYAKVIKKRKTSKNLMIFYSFPLNFSLKILNDLNDLDLNDRILVIEK